ncbi:MAG: hypothetical protein ACREEK_01740 [Bradyrhizobium sp.]
MNAGRSDLAVALGLGNAADLKADRARGSAVLKPPAGGATSPDQPGR